MHEQLFPDPRSRTDAPPTRVAYILLVLIVVLTLCVRCSHGAPNFVANSPVWEQAAERSRRECALFWTGRPLRGDWSQPCRMRVRQGDYPTAGATSFRFANGEVFGWTMMVQGTRDRLLDSAIPHEVNHTVMATLVRRPITRWVDEGAATLVESRQEHQRYRRLAHGWIDHPGNVWHYFDAAEYPDVNDHIMPLYVTGFSLTEYLISRHGRQQFLAFVKDPRRPSHKLSEHFQTTPHQLQFEWQRWLRRHAAQTESTARFDCASFECPYHVAWKPPHDQRPQLYVFSQPHCSACEAFRRDVARGYYQQYRIEYVTRSAASNWHWNRPEVIAAMRSSVTTPIPADSEFVVPAFWVERTTRYQTGYEGPSGAPGLVNWLLETLRHHLVPSSLWEWPRPNQPGNFPPTSSGLDSTQFKDEDEADNIDWSNIEVVLLVNELSDRLKRTRSFVASRIDRRLQTLSAERTRGRLQIRLLARIDEPQRFDELVQVIDADPRPIMAAVFVRRIELGGIRAILADRLSKMLARVIDNHAGDIPLQFISERLQPNDYFAGLAAVRGRQPYRRHAEEGSTAPSIVSRGESVTEQSGDKNNDPTDRTLRIGMAGLIARRLRIMELLRFLFQSALGRT